MIKQIVIYPMNEDGSLVKAICECSMQNFLFFAVNGELFLDGEELSEDSHFFCRECLKLGFSSQTLDTARRSYLLGKNGILGRFFEQYNIESVTYALEISLMQKDIKKSFIHKIPKFFILVKNKIKNSSQFFLKFFKEPATNNLEDKK